MRGRRWLWLALGWRRGGYSRASIKQAETLTRCFEYGHIVQREICIGDKDNTLRGALRGTRACVPR